MTKKEENFAQLVKTLETEGLYPPYRTALFFQSMAEVFIDPLEAEKFFEKTTLQAELDLFQDPQKMSNTFRPEGMKSLGALNEHWYNVGAEAFLVSKETKQVFYKNAQGILDTEILEGSNQTTNDLKDVAVEQIVFYRMMEDSNSAVLENESVDLQAHSEIALQLAKLYKDPLAAAKKLEQIHEYYRSLCTSVPNFYKMENAVHRESWGGKTVTDSDRVEYGFLPKNEVSEPDLNPRGLGHTFPELVTDDSVDSKRLMWQPSLLGELRDSGVMALEKALQQKSPLDLKDQKTAKELSFLKLDKISFLLDNSTIDVLAYKTILQHSSFIRDVHALPQNHVAAPVVERKNPEPEKQKWKGLVSKLVPW